MHFGSPVGLLWGLSLPVLFWLWRLAATQRQVRVPSLIPFEHLLKRPPRRRTHLIVSALFWFQLAALIGLTLALMQPMLVRRRSHTILMVLDTSASMGAKFQGSTVFEHAKQRLLGYITRKALTNQLFVMTTAPIAPLTSQPTSDATAVRRAVQEVRVNDLGGQVSTAVRVGRSLLGFEPDEIFVITDERRPDDLPKTRVQWITVGEPRPNVAIVGVDAQGPLCTPTDAHILATLQNFSPRSASVTLVAVQDGRQLTQERGELDPGARRTFALTLPQETTGWVEISLLSPGDGLEVDNHAWIDVHRHVTLPLLIQSSHPSFQRAMAAWLGACPTLKTITEIPTDQQPFLVVTDQEHDVPASAAATMMFLPPATPRPILSHWVVSSNHPIGSYLAPVEIVAAPLNLSPGAVSAGTPVVSGLIEGRKVPIVVADEREGRRAVFMLFEPSRDNSTPILLAFFNSLKWLMGQSSAAMTGEPLIVNGLRPGTVSVHRPDGSTQTIDIPDGTLRYEATTAAGLYRITQGSTTTRIAVNFFDPLESNLLGRVSTWHPAPEGMASTTAPHRTTHPLSHLLILLLLVILVSEWWRYSVKGTSAVRRPSTPT